MSDERLERLFSPEISLEQIVATRHFSRELVERCVKVLYANGAKPSTVGTAYYVPGRIEVLGKHTDYCGGRSLLCAIDRGFVFVATKRADQTVRVIDALRNESCELAMSADLSPVIGQWSNYPATVVRRVAGNFGSGAKKLSGIDIAFASDLPPAAGLSSSSAFIVGVFLTVASLNGIHRSKLFEGSIGTVEDLAHYCGSIENGSAFRALTGIAGVGTSGGSQDHAAILCCRENMLSQYGFSPIVPERKIGMPAEVELVVLQSGVVAEKTGDARARYNAVSAKARHLVSLWNAQEQGNFQTLAQVIRSNIAAVPRLHRMIDRSETPEFPKDELHDRLDQFVTESETLIPAAGQALSENQFDRFAELVAQSTSGAIRQLKNQVPQTIALVEEALKAGAVAASPFGAGFGGSVWAMVRRGQIADFAGKLPVEFSRQLLKVRASSGAATL